MGHGPYRVIQWATGSIDQIAIRHFADDPAFDLVGVFVASDAKHGKDAGDLAGIRRLGIAATTSIVDLLAIEPMRSTTPRSTPISTTWRGYWDPART